MFIDALTPKAPIPTLDHKAEHSTQPHLGTTNAVEDLHQRVHGDGTHCPICQLRVNSPAGAFPDPALLVPAVLGLLR